MAITHRDATVLGVEVYPTVSGSTAGGRDKDGTVYYFPNAPVSIGYWFDNEGVGKNDWNTHFRISLWVNGERVAVKGMLADTGRMSGNQSYTFYSHKFSQLGVYTVEVRGKTSKSATVISAGLKGWSAKTPCTSGA